MSPIILKINDVSYLDHRVSIRTVVARKIDGSSQAVIYFPAPAQFCFGPRSLIYRRRQDCYSGLITCSACSLPDTLMWVTFRLVGLSTCNL